MPALTDAQLFIGATPVDAVRLGSGLVWPPRPVPASPPASAAWEGDLAGEFREPFLDVEHLDTVSGVTMSVNKPTRDASNPLLEVAGTNTATWDYQKLYLGVHHDGTTWHLLYSCHDNDNGTDDRAAYATSTDGETFTKPNLGLVSYASSTANNLVGDWTLTSSRYYPDLGVSGLWVATAEKFIGGSATYRIYTSEDPTTGFTLAKSVAMSGGAEGKELVRREDGRWLGYYVTGHSSDTRRVVAMLSATTDIASDYSVVGTVLEGSGASDQRYYLGVDRIGELHYGFAMDYVESTGIINTHLAFSRDGLSWVEVDENWLPVGTSGAWDDQMTWGLGRIVQVGDEWQLYYTGSPVWHDAARPKDMRIGRATIPKGRVGQVAGTGTVTTALLHPTTGQSLSLNCDASGGSIEVEVLDGAGAPLTGYAHADAVDITADTFAIEPTWSGAATMPVDQDIQLRFHLTGATLFGYEIT